MRTSEVLRTFVLCESEHQILNKILLLLSHTVKLFYLALWMCNNRVDSLVENNFKVFRPKLQIRVIVVRSL